MKKRFLSPGARLIPGCVLLAGLLAGTSAFTIPAHADTQQSVLWATNPTPTSGQSVGINIQVLNESASSSWYIDLWELPSGGSWRYVGDCGTFAASQATATCTIPVSHTSGLYEYSSNGNSVPTFVDWGATPVQPPAGVASSTCDSGQQVAYVNTQGALVKLYTLTNPSTGEVDVCARAQDGTTHEGGMLAIKPGVPDASVGGLGVPTTDTNSTACWTTSGNTVPGGHPSTVGVLGQNVTFDVYRNATEAWLCVDGGSVHERVVVPITVPPSPSVDPGTTVTWTPDAS